jgi:glycosyltransferase involved in cell wall biosynthesis
MAEAGLAALRRLRDPLPPHRLMPNSVDLDAFFPRAAGEPPEFGLAYCGSLGGWYMSREMVDFARVAARRIPGKVLFLTPQVEEARSAGAGADWSVTLAVRPAEVPAWLRRARAGFFFVRPTPAKRAASPTKLAESLASGLPLAANPGVGDVEAVLEPSRVGVLVRSFDDDGYHDAAARLASLLDDPGVGARCRRLAETRYDLETAVDRYYQLYHELTGEER